MLSPAKVVRVFLGVMAAAAVLGGSSEARADWSVRVDPVFAVPLNVPQRDFFILGGAVWARAAYGSDLVDGHVGLGFMGIAPRFGTGTAIGSATTLGIGGRIKLPRGDRNFSPWLDADLAYVNSAGLSRAGVAVGLGVSVAISRTLWLSPVARYFQIVEPEKAGFRPDDPRFLLGGFEIEWGSPPKDAPPAAPPAECPPDQDHDGLVDSIDACPSAAGPPVTRGCPDRDGDGVPDSEDACVDVKGHASAKGCPDRDGDTVVDSSDMCPDKAGPPEQGGCPDTDGDGVHDGVDACPKVPGLAKFKGCPDTDGDGVTDSEDACPDKAGDPANRGCPVHALVVVTANNIEIKEKVFFDTDKATIQPKSFKVLNDVAAVLADSPKIRLRIEGHTDNAGKEKQNLTLSTDRARSVREYLVKRGVAGTRLEAGGFGQSRPLEPNDTPAGREKNRRVEFVILEGESGGLK